MQDPNSGGPSFKAIQIIVSFSGYQKPGYIASTTIHAKLKSNLETYLTAMGITQTVTMEIKAVDNSASGAGIHIRLYFANNNNDCLNFAYKMRNYPSENDQNDVEMGNVWTDAEFGKISSF